MDVKIASLEAVGVKMSQYPECDRPEIAFVGKSNVGKSSLINKMLNRKSLARTSSSPGKTRTINFYNVNNILYFVDLPGYGYAKASKTEIDKWGKMINEYLENRETLLSIILLIDIRHEPGINDEKMYKWLKDYGYSVIIAATKTDKINKSQIQKYLSIIKNKLKLDKEDLIIPFSSFTKLGVAELWKSIENELERVEYVDE